MKLYLFSHYDQEVHALVVAESLESAWELSGLTETKTCLWDGHHKAQLCDFDVDVFEIAPGLMFQGWGGDFGSGISKEKGAEPTEFRRAVFDEMLKARGRQMVDDSPRPYGRRYW